MFNQLLLSIETLLDHLLRDRRSGETTRVDDIMRIELVNAAVAPLNGALGDLHVQLDRRLREGKHGMLGSGTMMFRRVPR